MDDKDLHKMVYEFTTDEWHGYGTESLWVEVLDNDRVILKSVPFYVRGFSYGDVLKVRRYNEVIYFDQVVKNSGHSTYRIYSLDADQFYLDILLDLGCTYEKIKDDFYAVDVPSKVNVYKVYEVLELGRKRGAIDFEEGHCGHLITK